MTQAGNSTPLSGPVKPGGVIGIMGGGQLGRMTAMAAARLGYKCHIFCPEADSPAAQVSYAQTIAEYDDLDALHDFADACDVVTFEFENIPHESVQALAERVTVRPDWECLHVGQDRLREKAFLRDTAKVPVGPFAKVTGVDDLKAKVQEIGLPAVLKTARWGYDGKGQVLIREDTDLEEAWALMGRNNGILEAFIDLDCEVSVVIARSANGEIEAYDLVENRHRNHILDVTVAPAQVADALREDAGKIAFKIIDALNYTGLMAVEMFITKAGELLVNEIAPRPHNSGHWTIDACVTSQFEQFVRAVAGLPLGTAERHSDALMKNLIGPAVNEWQTLLGDPKAHLHLYGKREAREGRKMGHVTWVYPKGEGAEKP